MIAKDYEDFDYDLYFRSFANTWKKLDTKEYENNKIQTDTHPLHFLRINYTVRQFDEFIETYDLKPGDGMYLDPSERILIW
jgi:predicted metalloendopeptidase